MARVAASVLGSRWRRRVCAVAGLIPTALVFGCAGETGPTGVGGGGGGADLCTIPLDQIFDGGVGRDGIRSLENPALVAVDHNEAE